MSTTRRMKNVQHNDVNLAFYKIKYKSHSDSPNIGQNDMEELRQIKWIRKEKLQRF